MIIRRMRGGGKKANLLRTSVAEKRHGGDFPWFLFCLTYHRLGAGQDSNYIITTLLQPNTTGKTVAPPAKAKQGV